MTYFFRIEEVIRRETIGHDIFGRLTFQDRLSARLEPRVTGNLASRFIAHPKYDAGVDSVAQQVTMQDRRALPADWLEHQNIRRK